MGAFFAICSVLVFLMGLLEWAVAGRLGVGPSTVLIAVVLMVGSAVVRRLDDVIAALKAPRQ